MSKAFEQINHAIKLTNKKPTRMRPCSIRIANAEFIRQEVEEWLNKPICRPKSPFTSGAITFDQPDKISEETKLIMEYHQKIALLSEAWWHSSFSRHYLA